MNDPAIYITYLMAFGCLVFALWYGITGWNEKDNDEYIDRSINPEIPEE
ncbi:MAG: hypothetical protein LBU62_11860 [Bacteroidales bacterium]|nr:hypothetical protein [Bacteroidales bacterium]